MIDGLKPYPAMKESGVPWLGLVPEHWDVLPNRAVFSEIKETPTEFSERLRGSAPHQN